MAFQVQPDGTIKADTLEEAMQVRAAILQRLGASKGGQNRWTHLDAERRAKLAAGAAESSRAYFRANPGKGSISVKGGQVLPHGLHRGEAALGRDLADARRGRRCSAPGDGGAEGGTPAPGVRAPPPVAERRRQAGRGSGGGRRDRARADLARVVAELANDGGGKPAADRDPSTSGRRAAAPAACRRTSTTYSPARVAHERRWRSPRPWPRRLRANSGDRSRVLDCLALAQ